jgi:hypothetical protein
MLVVALTGCSQLGGAASTVGVQDVAQQGMSDAFRPIVTVNPPDGASGVAPTETVTALVGGGQFTKVDLHSIGGGPVPGAVSPDGERWSAGKPLKANSSYVLTTSVRSIAGGETQKATKFSTLSPGQQGSATINPKDGATMAGAAPVTAIFDKPVKNRDVVARALRVSANPPVNGTTQWVSDRVLLWQPMGNWPAGSKVIASLDIFGTELAPNLFGKGDVRSAFTVLGIAAAAGAPVDPALASPNMTDPMAYPMAAPGMPAPGAQPPIDPSDPGRLRAEPPRFGAPADPPIPPDPSLTAQPRGGAAAPANPRAAAPGARSPEAGSPRTGSPDAGSPDAARTRPGLPGADRLPGSEESRPGGPRRKPDTSNDERKPALPLL